MKKILLGLGMVTAIVAPSLTIIACGDDTYNEKSTEFVSKFGDLVYKNGYSSGLEMLDSWDESLVDTSFEIINKDGWTSPNMKSIIYFIKSKHPLTIFNDVNDVNSEQNEYTTNFLPDQLPKNIDHSQIVGFIEKNLTPQPLKNYFEPIVNDNAELFLYSSENGTNEINNSLSFTKVATFGSMIMHPSGASIHNYYEGIISDIEDDEFKQELDYDLANLNISSRFNRVSFLTDLEEALISKANDAKVKRQQSLDNWYKYEKIRIQSKEDYGDMYSGYTAPYPDNFSKMYEWDFLKLDESEQQAEIKKAGDAALLAKTYNENYEKYVFPI